MNPGPFATGFNDRMIDDPGDWFDPDKARPVVRVIADLVEAEDTQLVNFVPPDMLARMGLDKPH